MLKPISFMRKASAGASGAPSIVEAAYTSTVSNGATTLTESAWAHGAGSDRKVIVIGAGATQLNSITMSCTYGGTAMEQMSTVQTNTYERVYMWQALETDFPGGGSGDVVLTASSSIPNGVGMAIFTIQDVEQVALASMDTPQTSSSSTSDTITPSAADSLVIGVGLNSSQAGTRGWTAGLTDYGGNLNFGSSPTAKMIFGEAEQGNSLITCTNDHSGGRSSSIVASFQPA